jgi:hypothetical protein
METKSMDVLSLKTLALLEVLKDESKFNNLPICYQHLCTRIMFHYNNMCENKTDIYIRNCKIGSRKWFEDLVNNIDCHDMSDETHYLDNDIEEWCYSALDNFMDEEQEDESRCIVCGEKYWQYSKSSCDYTCYCDINAHSDSSDYYSSDSD